MKRIIYLLIPVLIALTVLSCKRDYDDDYMGSVDERLNATLTAYQNELTSAEHGWMANISTSEGIYRFWMKFYVNNGEVMNDLKGNRVTMITDNMNYDYSGVNGGRRFGNLFLPSEGVAASYADIRHVQLSGRALRSGRQCQSRIGPIRGSRPTSSTRSPRMRTAFSRCAAARTALMRRWSKRPQRKNGAASQAGMVKSIEALSRFIASQNYSYIETQKYGPVLFNFNLRSMSTSYEAADGKSLVHSDVTDS